MMLQGCWVMGCKSHVLCKGGVGGALLLADECFSRRFGVVVDTRAPLDVGVEEERMMGV